MSAKATTLSRHFWSRHLPPNGRLMMRTWNRPHFVICPFSMCFDSIYLQLSVMQSATVACSVTGDTVIVLIQCRDSADSARSVRGSCVAALTVFMFLYSVYVPFVFLCLYPACDFARACIFSVCYLCVCLFLSFRWEVSFRSGNFTLLDTNEKKSKKLTTDSKCWLPQANEKEVDEVWMLNLISERNGQWTLNIMWSAIMLQITSLVIWSHHRTIVYVWLRVRLDEYLYLAPGACLYL